MPSAAMQRLMDWLNEREEWQIWLLALPCGLVLNGLIVIACAKIVGQKIRSLYVQ